MFEKIRAGLSAASAERYHTQNLLECKDDLLYAWNVQDGCLLVINWRAAKDKGFAKVEHQTLMPSVPQNFQVDRVVASHEGSLVALAGARGVTVLELPRRWGPLGQFMEGKPVITCRSYNLDAQLFSNNPHLELRQLRWHPASPTDSHLLVLLSDNTMRLYDNATLRHVWRVGPLPQRTDANANASLHSTVQVLGELVTDFDIAPAIGVADLKDHSLNLSSSRLHLTNASLSSTQAPARAEKVVWPLVLLRENGNIYILLAGLDTDKPRLQGPLTITPQTVDNYGLDSCAILVMPSLPPTLVIAETNGRLHHALLLEAEQPDDSFNDLDCNLNIQPAEWTLHVLETVELELGLPRDRAEAVTHHSPIHLKRDFINEHRYFAYHNAGLHVVNISFIAELQRYLENTVTEDISLLSTPSRAEYIVCTKIDDSDERINAVLGFVLLQMPSGVALLLSSGQAISLKLVIDPKLLQPESQPTRGRPHELPSSKASQDHSEFVKLLEASFVDHIKNMLQRTVTQPILSLDSSSSPPSLQQCYELLTQSMEVLRSQYLKRHEVVRAEFAKHINKNILWEEQQRRDIDQLEKDREDIREKAHQLAERFEEISENQELILKQSQDLVREANTRLPCNTVAERDFAKEVERINNATKAMMKNILKSREAVNKQWYHISKYKETAKQKSFVLPEKQETVIKDVLMQIAAEIDGQIREVKRIKQILAL